MTLPTYATGTASVSAGGTVVTGVGTIWSGINAKQGDFIQFGTVGSALITEVTDTTHLKISAWPWATQSNVPYTIYQNYVGRVVGVAAAEDVGDMLERLKGYGPIFAVPDTDSMPDPSYGAETQYAYQQLTNTWWQKTGGIWVITSTPVKGYGGTSTTSITIGTGTKAFTTQPNLAYLSGQRVRAIVSTDASKWLEGVVTYNATTGALSIASDTTSGTGTFASWGFTVGVGDLSNQGITTFTGSAASGNVITVRDTTPVATGIGGRIGLQGLNNAAAQINYAQIKGYGTNATPGSESGDLQVLVKTAGADTPWGRFTSNGRILFNAGGQVIGNSSGVITLPNVTDTLAGQTFVQNAVAGGNTFQQADRLAASFLTLTTNVVTNIISISLAAGNWLVWGNVVFAAQATTAYSETHVSISTTSGALDASPGSANAEHVTYATGQNAIKPTAPKHLILGSTTTVYLTATHTLTGGSPMLAYGSIFALPVGA